MAVYDGFFDAVMNEETGEFDRAYGSGDFIGYFAGIIGSGVCIHNNPDSFRVRLEDGNAVISPGYLFIQGYWLRNDADYSIPVSGPDPSAVVAHLNMGKRMIELEAVPTAESYPDSLVLALVDPETGTVEDTRHNAQLCGVISTAGDLSTKVEWAIHYIDTEIEDKLAAAEAAIAEQSQQLDQKIQEVQEQISKITPSPVGTIQFSAAQDMGPDWLPCNGDFITEDQYPDLVAALGKLTPSGDKFKLISDGEIGPQISNGVIYNGRMWVYSFSAKKLYGVDLNGTGAIKEISISSNDSNFNSFIRPTTNNPIALSIVPQKIGTGAKLFLSQIIQDADNVSARSDSGYVDIQKYILIFESEFSDSKSSISVSSSSAKHLSYEDGYQQQICFRSSGCVPYIISKVIEGKELFYCTTTGVFYYRYGSTSKYSAFYITWYLGESSYSNIAGQYSVGTYNGTPTVLKGQRISFTPKNKDDAVFFFNESFGLSLLIDSIPTETYSREKVNEEEAFDYWRTAPLPLTVAGSNYILAAFDLNYFPSTPIHELLPSRQGRSNVKLPSAAHIFTDGATYLWGKDIYMIFVGTGIIFSRTLEEGSFGYLDTTSVLGTITQFGYLDYSQDEGTLYLLGQDTSNRVKVAKIVLNTLYDYANNGAWLPMIAADGVPAYIKSVKREGEEVPPDGYSFNLTTSTAGNVSGGATFTGLFSATINGVNITSGRKTFTDPIVNFKMTATSDYTNQSQYTFKFIIVASYRKDGEYHGDDIVGMTVGPNKSITIGQSADANVDISAFNGLDVEIVFTTNV